MSGRRYQFDETGHQRKFTAPPKARPTAPKKKQAKAPAPKEVAAEPRRQARRKLTLVRCHACDLYRDARALDAQVWNLAQQMRAIGSKNTMVGMAMYTAHEARPPSEFRTSPAVEHLKRHRFDKHAAIAAALEPGFRRAQHVARSVTFGLDETVAGLAFDKGVFTFDTEWAVFMKDLEWSDWPSAAVGWITASPLDEDARRNAWGA